MPKQAGPLFIPHRIISNNKQKLPCQQWHRIWLQQQGHCDAPQQQQMLMMPAPQAAMKHVSHVGAGLHSLGQVPELHDSASDSRSAVQSLNLHGNAIRAMDGLPVLPNLTSLNLSSNSISLIANLSGLAHLTSLNLASNSITQLRGLEGLSKLQQLNVSYNLISCIQGITALHGANGSLSRLNLQHNQLPSLQALAPLAGCLHLQQLKVGGNPCTISPAAYAALRQALPQVQQLDDSEAVSLAASWQMAHAQLQAYDAGQQQQQQQQAALMPAPQRHAAGSKAAAAQHASRSPKHHARRPAPAPDPEEEASTATSSSSQSISMESFDAADAAVADSGHQQQQRRGKQDDRGSGGSSSKARAGHKADLLASPSKRPKPDQSAKLRCESGVQTDDFISAAEVELVTEAQDLRQQLSSLAGEGVLAHQRGTGYSCPDRTASGSCQPAASSESHKCHGREPSGVAAGCASFLCR
jgi:Leucine-rich repeat (LRR) protein